ncbi:putative disease resistance protein At4g11170 isoform X4 [Arachis ipaensis]|uniref:putative disease resistance protein At4g11170 isoform X4 n=1 Tax=Arachis ipaensis TaxID=130454 RepID=UPI000A2B9061|nr:putative disease resistance protein At4g11170 isoform X4 [Arachis ipaensis]
MALSLASSSSSSPLTTRYDVFISFRGEDTRNGFTSHLHSALLRNRIETFIDYRIPKGGVVWNELVEAIRDSKLFVVIFSENYASSSWCLRELVEIMKCKKKNEQVIVIPVFYKIEPTRVRKQSGSYRRAFDEHERSSNRKHVQQWRTALTEASDLSGFTCNHHRQEAELIDEIVKAIFPNLNSNCYRDELKSPFICNRNYTSVKSLLKFKSEKVLVIGIWGMAGIGKTTIATTLLHECSSEYESHCFLAFSKNLERKGLNHICAKLLSRLLNEDLRIDNIRVIHSSIIRKIKHKKVFVVLDDVTNSQIAVDLIQLFRNCLSSGSKIILTTKDRNVLTSGGVEEIHEVKEMNFEDSLKLFSHNAFCDSHPKEDYYELSTRVVADYAKGIPLALNILGSFLRTRGKSEWDSALRKLRRYPNPDIQQVLRLSYDALDDDEKNILLDIACFFHDHEMKKITRILKSCGFYADIGIKSLLDKSLVSIYSNGRDECIKMHSLIQEMCRKIIHEESSKNGGRQIRLWNTEEVCNIFQNERDIYGVESMIVDMNEITIDPRIIIIALRKMPKLRLLALRGNINMDLEGNRVFLQDFQLPNDLRYIEWNKCPLNFVRSIPWPQKLVQLSMPDSNVQKLWDTPQNLPSLEIIDLRGCKRLIECPNLAGATNLKLISLYGCESLQDVHPSIFSLPKIQNLYVNFCTSLKRLCSGYCSPSLCTLWAIGCCNLEEFSIPIMSDHSNLTLILPATALTEVPSTIMHLKNLEWFGFNISYSLQKLPLNFASKISLKDPIKHEDDTCIMLSRILPTPAFLSLKQLSFFECKSLSKLPDNIHVLQSLQLLHLQSCHVITSLPKSIKNLQQLMGLVIMDCKMLQYVPPLPPSIIYFNALNCKSLETLSSLTSEPPREDHAWFEFHNCTKLADDAYEAVLKDLKSRIELVANNDGYPHNEARHFYYYLPSKESIINEWFPDYYSREASIIVEVAPDHKISSCLVGCILISQYQSCNLTKKNVIFGWECYLGKGCNEWELIATSADGVSLHGYFVEGIQLEMVSDHKVVWYDGEGSNKITEAIKERKRDTACNPILKFEFYANTEDNEKIVIKGCGIRWMHVHVNDDGEISPDATHEGYESHDSELEDLESETVRERKIGKRVHLHCDSKDYWNSQV